MTTFQVQVAQNQFLSQGADLVHAVMSVSSSGPAGAGPIGRPLVEALLIDCSGSMQGAKIRAARDAVEKAIDLLRGDAWFFVVAGTESARLAVPLAQATAENKRMARAAVRNLDGKGGTAMSTWLELARSQFEQFPAGIRHALLLTDGKNEGEPDARLVAVLNACEGRFQCDARGVGTDWIPDQLRKISSKLLGTVDIIPDPTAIEADFRRVIEAALGKSIADVSLRLWTPVGASVEFCTQVYPEKVDLTALGRPDPAHPQNRDYPTGAWGEEKRDYHIAIKVKPGQVGQKMLAGRASLIVRENGTETKLSEGMILAVWTSDEEQSAVIHPSVAHYTGQVELADVIQQGLKARQSGDEAQATSLLGRAVQLASKSNPETMKLLRNVVDVQDEKQGTVRLRKGVRKEDEFALDTRSTKTARVVKGS